LLERFGHQPIHRLLDCLRQMKRMDILLSLQPFLTGLTSSNRALRAEKRIPIDSGLLPDSITATTSSPWTSYHPSPGTSSSPIDMTLPEDRFNLLIHYTESYDDRKAMDWLVKNLRRQEKRYSMKFFSIGDLSHLMMGNVSIALHRIFLKAEKVVVIFTESLIESLHSMAISNVNDPMDRSHNVYLYRQTENEFVQNNALNRRCIAVVFPGMDKSHLPTGWPRNTLVYEFPSNHQALFTAIFPEYSPHVDDLSNGQRHNK